MYCGHKVSSYKIIWGVDGQIASNFLCNAFGETGFVCRLGIDPSECDLLTPSTFSSVS